jgi:hypothetical protein
MFLVDSKTSIGDFAFDNKVSIIGGAIILWLVYFWACQVLPLLLVIFIHFQTNLIRYVSCERFVIIFISGFSMHHGKLSCSLEYLIWHSYQCDQDKEIIFQKQVYISLSFLHSYFVFKISDKQ